MKNEEFLFLHLEALYAVYSAVHQKTINTFLLYDYFVQIQKKGLKKILLWWLMGTDGEENKMLRVCTGQSITCWADIHTDESVCFPNSCLLN